MKILMYNEKTKKYEEHEIMDNYYIGMPKYKLFKILLKRMHYYSLDSETTMYFMIFMEFIEFAANTDGMENYRLLVEAVDSFDKIMILGYKQSTNVKFEKLLEIASYWKAIKLICNSSIVEQSIVDYYENDEIASALVKLIS